MLVVCAMDAEGAEAPPTQGQAGPPKRQATSLSAEKILQERNKKKNIVEATNKKGELVSYEAIPVKPHFI